MAKTIKIQIYLKDIIDDFGIVHYRRINSVCMTHKHVPTMTRFKRTGKFLVAGMPQGDTIFSSLN